VQKLDEAQMITSPISRPSLCPWHTPGASFNPCGHPQAVHHLYCDTAGSAIADDGFPQDCPLRGEE